MTSPLSRLTSRTARPAPRRFAGWTLAGLLVATACTSSADDATQTTSSSASSITTSSTTTTSTTTTTTTTLPPTTAPPTTAAPPALRAASPAEPLRTLIVGDSTAFVMGHAVIRSNIEGLLGPEVLFKTSSSLVRPDFFDWPFFLGWVVDNDPPEVMLLSLGANDHQPVTTPDGRVLDVHEEGWRAEYLRRVQELSTRITDAGTRLYWIGQPLARSAGYSAAMAKINGVFREVADQDEDVVFLDIWSRLSTPDGAYTDTVPGPDGQPVQIRQADGIHLTDAGGDVAAPLIWESLRIDWGG